MTIALNPTEAYLDNEMSGRLRQLLRNTCDINGVAVRQLKLAGVFGDDSSPSTVARIVSGANDSRIHSRFLPHCIAWLSQVIGCPTADLNDYLCDGNTENASVQEMTARRVFPHTAPQLTNYANEVKAIKTQETECWLVTDIPSASLLPEPVMQRVLRWKTGAMPQPFHDFRIELDFSRRQWHQFQENAGHGLSAFGVILTLSGMDQLLKPDGACSVAGRAKTSQRGALKTGQCFDDAYTSSV